ncbi:sperm flagellar protein 1-like isoform X2 [Drosophila innubila]|uniref:sperm flagellar protein 1-like isoform X2 n=1 Tax=Drosophila innubila TaxID=198719 RepID=UPI00148C2E9C|nr:sperm flagellar protein 1-like isoform X2 [Drosophila innubila]
MPRQTTSAKKTSLNAVEQYELNQWLEQNHINSTNLRRSFTDVLPLARLLSRYYPDLIDLNYYPPRNSVHNKLCNWESFNKRVLARLGLHLSRDQMVRVARSVPGSVDLLLFNIMRIQMAAERKAREANGSTDEDEEDDRHAEADNVANNELHKNAEQLKEQPTATTTAANAVKIPAALDDDDDAGSVLPPKPNMPKTLKLAQAALKRSERLQMATAGILQRAAARGNNSNRRVMTTGSDVAGASGITREQQQQSQQQQQQPQQRGRQSVATKKRQDRPF